ncbi:MAG: hypothetical protein ABUS57_11215 [Pseudomonadota bacterium]
MVDTVLLHTAGSEDRANRLAEALTDRAAITYPVTSAQRGVGFGPQVVVVGVVPDVAQGDEARLLELVSTSPGLKFLLTLPNATAPSLADCVVLSGAADAQHDAALVRGAIAEALAAKHGGKGKKKKAQPRAATPTKTDAPPRPAPPVKLKPARVVRETPRLAKEDTKPPKEPRAFDAGTARRARKVGYFFGVAMGAALAVGAVMLLAALRGGHAPAPVTHPAELAPPSVAAAPTQTVTPSEAAPPTTPAPRPATPTTIASAPASTPATTNAAPAATGPVEPATSTTATTTEEAPDLRGHLEQPAQQP